MRKRLLQTILVGLICLGLSAQPQRILSAPLDPPVSPPAAVWGVTLGAYVIPTAAYAGEITAFNSLTGKSLGIVEFFTDWSNPLAPYTFLMNQIRDDMSAAERPLVMIAWAPENARAALGCDRNYAGVPSRTVANGVCDTYIRDYARAMRDRGERILLRFAQEMNLSNHPFWVGHFNQTPDDFIAMWRHVRELFREEGANNVEFVWAPNFKSHPDTPGNTIYEFYPGDAYVDWVSVNAYNYYTYGAGGSWPWQLLEDFVDPVLKEFACRYPKPQMIHEMATVEGISKTEWIADAYNGIPSYPFLRAAVWYNDRDFSNPNIDFRITSSTDRDGSVAALPVGSGVWTRSYGTAVSNPVYNSVLPPLATVTPPRTYCGTPIPDIQMPSTVVLTPTQTSSITLSGFLLDSSQPVSVQAAPGSSITIRPSGRQLTAPWSTLTISVASNQAEGGRSQHTVRVGNTEFPLTVVVFDITDQLYLPLTMQ